MASRAERAEAGRVASRSWLTEPLTDTWGQYSASGSGIHVHVRNRSVPERLNDFIIYKHEGIEMCEQRFAIVIGRPVNRFGAEIVDIGKSALRNFPYNTYTELSGDTPRIDADDAGESDDYNGDEWLTDDAIEDALRHIRPDIEYGECIQLAYGVHNYGSISNRKRLFEQ